MNFKVLTLDVKRGGERRRRIERGNPPPWNTEMLSTKCKNGFFHNGKTLLFWKRKEFSLMLLRRTTSACGIVFKVLIQLNSCVLDQRYLDSSTYYFCDAQAFFRASSWLYFSWFEINGKYFQGNVSRRRKCQSLKFGRLLRASTQHHCSKNCEALAMVIWTCAKSWRSCRLSKYKQCTLGILQTDFQLACEKTIWKLGSKFSKNWL